MATIRAGSWRAPRFSGERDGDLAELLASRGRPSGRPFRFDHPGPSPIDDKSATTRTLPLGSSGFVLSHFVGRRRRPKPRSLLSRPPPAFPPRWPRPDPAREIRVLEAQLKRLESRLDAETREVRNRLVKKASGERISRSVDGRRRRAPTAPCEFLLPKSPDAIENRA
jgi:hypothetical protein